MTDQDATLVVGPGRVGATLARALDRAGWPLTAVAGRRPDALEAMAPHLDPGVRLGSIESLSGAFPVVVLAVVDGAIRRQCETLVSQGLVDRRSVVLHLSGVHAREVLEAAARAGAATGSMHPLQTFPDPDSGLRHLPGSHWFLEGSPPAVAAATRLVAALEGEAHTVAAADKALYHASASIACNYLTVLLDAALETAEAAGLGRADMMQALYPLVRTALDNARAGGTTATLTGPVSRGDVETIGMHLDAMKGEDELLALYSVLGRRAVRMAVEAGRLDSEAAAALLARLSAAAPREDA